MSKHFILKSITSPSMNQFDSLIKEASAKARKYGIKKSDVARAVEEARKKSGKNTKA